ncbi:hexaprenyl pyrophosphate synthase [Sulfolobus tengchongensis]|uniref:Hexaprenyl pyrophosphate synthase n=1 Tax=Sulfolobus tengchongensis TaxID=207809 RepID=A0AAX4L347_9CREN
MSIIEFWLEAKEIIDKLIEQFLDSNKEWDLVEMSSYILKDGKRFRGTLNMFFTVALGGNIKDSYGGALAIEILHSASLALDDIVDLDVTRRGDKAAWVVYGNRKIIFITNYLIPTALRIIQTSYGDDALNTSIELWKDTAVGALRDMYNNSDYVKTIELKTGSLFKLSTVLSAYASNHYDVKDKMLEVGRYLGIIYQVIDDFVDYKTKRIEEISGSAKQLFEYYKSGKLEDYVKSIYSEYKQKYNEIIDKIPFQSEYINEIRSLPEFLANGLLKEVGIDKI